jgi:hypothetical protein
LCQKPAAEWETAVCGRWARKGGSSVAALRLGYKNFYAYGAVCPVTGEDATLPLPWVNTGMASVFLACMAGRPNGRRRILVMDSGDWRVSWELPAPPNIKLAILWGKTVLPVRVNTHLAPSHRPPFCLRIN